NVTLDEDYCRPYSVEPGNYVKISFTDTGVGMDETTRQKIFEPFFTTQKMRRGAGLGLASVYGIINNHDGIINVYSEKGHGTTINIYLPASVKEIKREEALADEVLRGTQTILLVDDEEMIVDIGAEILESLGYKVLSAKNGTEAIEIVRKAHKAKSKDQEGNEHGSQNCMKSIPDLVILDMIMPDMSGGDTYDRIKDINPDIKVLLSSGYSINGQATKIMKRGCNGFIQKPFTITALSKKIREILDEKSHAD
ncbi:MAG: response regulator, partial [Desulfatiglandales bacterium]